MAEIFGGLLIRVRSVRGQGVKPSNRIPAPRVFPFHGEADRACDVHSRIEQTCLVHLLRASLWQANSPLTPVCPTPLSPVSSIFNLHPESTASRHHFHHPASSPWHLLCELLERFPHSSPLSTLVSLSVLHTAAQTGAFKMWVSDVMPLPKTLQWLPNSWEVKVKSPQRPARPYRIKATVTCLTSATPSFLAVPQHVFPRELPVQGLCTCRPHLELSSLR